MWEIDWSFESAAEYRSYLEAVDPSMHHREVYKKLEALIDQMERVEVGQIAPDFKMNNVDGDPVKLSSIYEQSSFLLVEFWASNCGPCCIDNEVVRSYGLRQVSQNFLLDHSGDL